MVVKLSRETKSHNIMTHRFIFGHARAKYRVKYVISKYIIVHTILYVVFYDKSMNTYIAISMVW